MSTVCSAIAPVYHRTPRGEIFVDFITPCGIVIIEQAVESQLPRIIEILDESPAYRYDVRFRPVWRIYHAGSMAASGHQCSHGFFLLIRADTVGISIQHVVPVESNIEGHGISVIFGVSGDTDAASFGRPLKIFHHLCHSYSATARKRCGAINLRAL